MGLPLLLTLALLGPVHTGDVVHLEGGRTVEGDVLYEDEREVVVRVGARERVLDAREVERVESRDRSLSLLLDRMTELAGEDAGADVDLARFCRDRGLDDEARLLWLRILAHDPDDEAAHTALGHLRQPRGWKAEVDGRKYSWDKVLELRRAWRTAWELDTTHYRVRTNLELGRGLGAAFELERLYRLFYRQFGRDLRLYDVEERLVAELHADSSTFPESAPGRTAWFDPKTNTLYLDASGRLDLGPLYHEATHQLLHVTAKGKSSGRAGIPAWLDEGLAEYVRTCAEQGLEEGFSGRLSRDDRHFVLQGRATDPDPLRRVLTFDSGDFQYGDESLLRYAESYTLVHFCLHGDGERWRPGFLDFLRSSYAGKGSSTHFKKSLGADEQELEQAWRAHVRLTAGDR